MRILKARIRNYRTLESLDLEFPTTYTAICGPNDCGKSNVIRAIRSLMREDERQWIMLDKEEGDLSLKEDYPKWKDSDQNKEIEISLNIQVDSDKDAGLFQFLQRQLSLSDSQGREERCFWVSLARKGSGTDIKISVDQKDFCGIEAQEVLKRLQTSRTIVFHNSTRLDPRFYFRAGIGRLRDLSYEHATQLEKLRKTVNNTLKRITRAQQQQLQELLGRLEHKYQVNLVTPTFELEYTPFTISLGETKFEVPLDDWGSGTRNRTLILLGLFRAKQIADSKPSADKITPIMMIEEPESFLVVFQAK